jgi:aromatic ring-cleaving dioxygenase
VNGCGPCKAGLRPTIIKRKEIPLQPLDPEQLKFVEILAKLMMENEVFKEEYTEKDFNEVIDWLTKLRGQIDITIETLQEQIQFER